VDEIAKNYAQLDYEKTERIQHILVKIVREIQKSLDKYRNPKELALKAMRGYNSDVTMAAIFLTSFSLSIKTDQKLTPEQISEKLPKSIVLNPRQRTEALRKVQKEGFLDNVKGQPTDKRRGRPKADEHISYNRKGGPHSYYVITEGLEELKKLMSDSNATQLIHDRLKKEGIIQEYYKLLIIAFFYAIKKENKTKGKLFELVKASTPFYISQISEDDFSDWDNFVNLLRSKDDEELNLLADKYAYNMAERSPFDYFAYLLKIVKNPME
jgi:hypothetical protein